MILRSILATILDYAKVRRMILDIETKLSETFQTFARKEIGKNSVIDTNLCQLEHYRTCLKDITYDGSCEQDCLKQCKSIYYNQAFLHQLKAKEAACRIQLTAVSWNYAVFEETYFWTMKTFLGAFGGALALWLGIDFIIILRSIAAFIKYASSNVKTSAA